MNEVPAGPSAASAVGPVPHQAYAAAAPRLRQAFAHAASEERAALVAYLTFGDPSPHASLATLAAAARVADVIELGVPFSDPSADGPSIQRAMTRSLDAGAGLPGALSAVRTLRQQGIQTPVVLFGYYNPIFVFGVDAFARQASEVGIDAVLTVDVPVDELAELAIPLANVGLGVVPLLAPTSTASRFALAKGFVPPFCYYISMTGVTGSNATVSPDDHRIRAASVAAIKAATNSWVGVGFGIRTPGDVAATAQYADGVIVGSALVDCIATAGPQHAPGAVTEMLSALKAACARRRP